MIHEFLLEPIHLVFRQPFIVNYNLPSKTKNSLGNSCQNPLSFEEKLIGPGSAHSVLGIQSPDQSHIIPELQSTLKLPQITKSCIPLTSSCLPLSHNFPLNLHSPHLI